LQGARFYFLFVFMIVFPSILYLNKIDLYNIDLYQSDELSHD
jgi:hypothetical protein